LGCSPAFAHPVPFSYLDLRIGAKGMDGTLTAHAIDLAHDLRLMSPGVLLEPSFAEKQKNKIMSLFQERLVITANGETLKAEVKGVKTLPDKQAVELRLRFAWRQVPGVMRVHCRMFPYDDKHETFLNVYEGGKLTHQEIFDKDHSDFDYFTGSRQGTWAVLEKFIPAGVHHIFIGPDHILFIIGLLLLGGSIGRLLKIVTAFTVAHSITLALAALNVYNPPARLIEPAIALSIVYVGADNLLVGKQGRDVRALIAFLFGFIHGFGFANVLKEFGLPSQALGWSLFAFNFGVEIGQACIVLAVAPLLEIIRRRDPHKDKRVYQRVITAGSVFIIMAGGYWFVERVFWAG
jgi:hydrogenase/urease accessory protein HupE